MAGGLSQSAQQKVLDYLFGGTAFPNIAGPHLLALYRSARHRSLCLIGTAPACAGSPIKPPAR